MVYKLGRPAFSRIFLKIQIFRARSKIFPQEEGGSNKNLLKGKKNEMFE